jgi:pimeloyl-ACP methyl ester carboxylesterase
MEKEARTSPIFTPARIVALVLLALAVLALGYLRFSGSDPVSVPSGAKAGDLILDSCGYGTENGSYDADCGTLVVPENRASPQSRLIAVPVARIRARSAAKKEPIFRLQGGPGISNMTFPQASRFAGDRDVILVGYRGVDGSSRLDCPEVASALGHSHDFIADKTFRAYADGFRDCAQRLTGDGVDLAGYSLSAQVDDLEAARKALGYDRIDLVSESVGTRLAMIYAWRYPKRIHRSVMIAVNPPGNFIWRGKTIDEQVRRYSDYCAKDRSCSKRTDDLAALMRRKAHHMPDRWLFLPIKDGHARAATFFGLMETTPENAPLTAPMVNDSWLAAEDDDASGLWFQSFAADLFFPKAFVWGEYAAIGRADAEAARRYFAAGGGRDSILGDPGSRFLWADGRLVDAWPSAPNESEYSRVRRSDVETLLIGGELDFAAPPQNGTRELLPALPNGHEVLLPGFGHSTSFFQEQQEAGTHLINTFLDTGKVDDSLYVPQAVDFTPEVSYPALAKGIAGTMVGLALLTVLSLLWMAFRVRRRSFGWKTSAVLRSVYPVVLGFGGWFLGVLIVLTTKRGIPLDHELLASVSIGLPIGVGIYLAWVNGEWTAWTKATGFAAAVGGALVGAWLGFNVAEGLGALLTTTLGAVTGANLILLGLDIAWDAQARDRFAEAGVKDELEAQTTAG